MKTNKIFLMIPFLFLVMGMGGCEDKINVTDLYHTWKFQGFSNSLNNSFEKANPSDCENCFILTFSKDGTLLGRTVNNSFSGKYIIEQKDIKTMDIISTEIYDPGNGGKFLVKMNLIHKYEIIDNKLRLYYDQNNDYLLFNLSK